MRITGGALRGRILATHGCEGIRPTTDRARETLFTILGNHLAFEEATVLDLFAGSGALGIEALSRGAQNAVFVDKSRRNARAMETALRGFGVSERSRILVADVMKALAAFARERRSFSLIFCDPPYAAKLSNAVFSAITANGIADKNAVFVCEHERREVALPQTGWELLASRSFGDTVVEAFQRQSAETPPLLVSLGTPDL